MPASPGCVDRKHSLVAREVVSACLCLIVVGQNRINLVDEHGVLIVLIWIHHGVGVCTDAVIKLVPFRGPTITDVFLASLSRAHAQLARHTVISFCANASASFLFAASIDRHTLGVKIRPTDAIGSVTSVTLKTSRRHRAATEFAVLPIGTRKTFTG